MKQPSKNLNDGLLWQLYMKEAGFIACLFSFEGAEK